MLRIPLALKLTSQLVFSAVGIILLAIAVFHAGRTMLAISSNPPVTQRSPVNPVEQTINKALELVKNQTSSD